MKHIFLLVGLLGLLLAGCQKTSPDAASFDALSVMKNDRRLGTFTTAIETDNEGGGLGTGASYTVFAPTSDAFAAFFEASGQTPQGFLESGGLSKLLSYHVAEGKLTAADLVERGKAKTLQGSEIAVTSEGETVLLNGTAKVLQSDIMAVNAIIHIIDEVLVPTTAPQPGNPEPEPNQPAPPEPGEPTIPAPLPENPAPAPQPTPTAPVTPELQTMLESVNSVRAQGANCGGQSFGAAGPLTLNAQLSSAAQKHSEDMAASQEMSHTTPAGAVHFAPGTTFSERAEQEGYSYRMIAENVAFGYPTVEAVMDGWLNSLGHCRNIMNPELTELGLGESDNYWTQVFGTPR